MEEIVTTTNSFTITCAYAGTIDPTIEWFHDRTGLRDKVEESDSISMTSYKFEDNKKHSTLEVTDASQDSNSGSYICVAKVDIDGQSYKAEDVVDVTVRLAEITNAISGGLVTDGDLRVTCIITADKLPNKVSWSNKENPVETSKSVFITQQDRDITNGKEIRSMIQFKNFTISDEGRHTCKAEYDDDAGSPTASVDILFSSVTADQDCPNLDLGSGNSLEVACTLSATAEPSKVVFSAIGMDPIEGEIEKVDNDYRGTATLNLKSHEDTGFHQCTFTLSNSATASASIYVMVRRK